MLIDGKNCVYRAIYAGLSDKFFVESKRHSAVIFFRFLVSYIKKFNPNTLHVFWDSPKQSLWRKTIYTEYKEGRKHRAENIEEIVNDTINTIKILLPLINVKMYEKESQEADDLIYSFCKVNFKKSNIIISSDGDFKQIPYYMSNVILFDPLNNRITTNNDLELDPVELKCLQGEKGDNISGYNKVGPVTAESICRDNNKRIEFFKTFTPEIYIRNRKLIDLSMCPYNAENIFYINEMMTKPLQFEKKLFITKLYELKVRGIAPEINNILYAFKFQNGKIVTHETT